MNDNDIIQLAKHHFGAFFKSSDVEVRLAALVAVEKDKEIERLREALRDIAISENSMYQESRAKLALGEDQNIWRMCGVNTDDVLHMANEAGIVMSLTDDRVTLNKLNRFLELHLKTLVSEGYRQCAKGQQTTQFCGLLEEAVAERDKYEAIIADMARMLELQQKSEAVVIDMIAAAVKAEREACAKLCENIFQTTPLYTTYAQAAQDCAEAIWARGET